MAQRRASATWEGDLFKGSGTVSALSSGLFTDAGVTARLLPSPPLFASCDPALVEQILLNLLKNAIEALSPGNTVSITTWGGEAEASIEIFDDGPGLDPDAEAHLFRPFSTTKGAQGTGLGLAVSRRLAQTLGGDLVRMPSVRGVRWRLTLPATGRA